MALVRIDHVPETIKVNLPLNIILPEPGQMGAVPISQRKVLYLLHGLSDDASAWQRFTSIETLAAAYGLVVVMPSVGRSFYSDQPNGQQYFTYLTEELPQYLEDVFGLLSSGAGQPQKAFGAEIATGRIAERLGSTADAENRPDSFGFLALVKLVLEVVQLPRQPRDPVSSFVTVEVGVLLVGQDGDRAGSGQTFGDGFSDGAGVAEHRLHHDQCSHRTSLPLRGTGRTGS